MAKFKFRDNTLKLEIEDKTYILDISNFKDTKKLLTIADEAVKVSEDGNTPETIEKMMTMMENAVDTILGEGATKEIFEDREINFLDLIDLLVFLSNEISAFRSEKLEKVYSVNRKDELIN